MVRCSSAFFQRAGKYRTFAPERGESMGEIIISLLIGGFLVVAGIAMNVILYREEKRWKAGQDDTASRENK